MLEEQITALEIKLEALEEQQSECEEMLKSVKAEKATVKRAIKTMNTLTEKLSEQLDG